MKLFRILSVVCATFVFASLADAQIKQGASSIGIYGSLQKATGSDTTGTAMASYDYFLTDNLSLSLLGGGFFGSGSNTYLANANISFYLSRDKVAPYIGAGGGYIGGSGGFSEGAYRGYVGLEAFVSERTSLDTRVSYEKAASGGSSGIWQATIGFKIYLK